MKTGAYPRKPKGYFMTVEQFFFTLNINEILEEGIHSSQMFFIPQVLLWLSAEKIGETTIEMVTDFLRKQEPLFFLM